MKLVQSGQAVEAVFNHFGKNIQLPPPFVYSDTHAYPCSSTQVPEDYGAYWYHPDHLGSSSYITNLDGEISQHMEYLPFGETLVEEHLNSNNSPYKFNAKEFDSETGNYYYGARYYDPKWVIWLSVDPEFAKFPGWSPYNYTFQNPINLVDPDGKAPRPPKIIPTGPIGFTLKVLNAIISNSGKEKETNNSTNRPSERPRSSGILGVGIELQGNKEGIAEVPVAERGTKVFTIDGEPLMELTTIYGPQLPGGGTALVPDGEGFPNEKNAGPVQSESSYDIIYTAKGQATSGSRYGSGSEENDRGVMVKGQSTKNLEEAKRDSAHFVTKDRFVVPGTIRIERDTIENKTQ